jgi:hypothetical protein
MDHDPDMPCFDLSAQALKDAGIPIKRPPMSPREFKSLVQKANRALIIVLAIFIAIILIGILIGYYSR